MSDERKPQVGEVWTNEAGEPWECLKVLTSGTYVWFAYGTVAVVDDQTYLTPPGPQPPEWLADRWVNVWPDVVTNTVHQTGQLADLYASPGRIGRVSLTGQWVPCDGKRVLA